MTKSVITVYCKVCGNSLFTSEEVTKVIENNKKLNANVGVEPGKIDGLFSLIGGKIGTNYNKKEETTTEYERKVCSECRNDQMLDSNIPFNPLRCYPLKNDPLQSPRVVIIPYSLYLYFKECEYEDKDIEEIVSIIYIKYLVNIKKLYGKNGGINPCEEGRLGYKFKFKYKSYETTCWAILGDMDGKFAFRLCFRSRKGIC